MQTFSQPNTVITGPQHPHLHTSGNQTHPIIVLFNALVTGKRIIFLGHHRPAGQVSSYVLSACALGSGCGIILRGFIKRAFPYANLTNREEWESMYANPATSLEKLLTASHSGFLFFFGRCSPGYIAGVTNPIFESSGSWDLLCDIGTSRMVISKDIHTNYPAIGNNPAGQLLTRTGTLKAESSVGSEEEMAVRPSKELSSVQKAEFIGKFDNADNMFMDDVSPVSFWHRLCTAHFVLSCRRTDHFRDLAALWRGACTSALH